jgi:Zn-dependent peptidase ImmA (M78 family)
MTEGFQPARLSLARRRRGIGKGTLGTMAGMSARIITRYESGRNTPSTGALARIAEVLNFPVAFFFLPEPVSIDAESVSFRSMARMTAGMRDSALASGELAMELDAYIDSRFQRPNPQVPELRGHSPENAAEIVRVEWGIGLRPITNMVHLLESRGIRVYSLLHERREIDAFSLWRGDTPFIFLNTLKSAERSRYDSCHELGHLVLHRHSPSVGKEAEMEADRFAAAFLMPRAQIIATAPRNPTVADIIAAKRIWGVSALAYTVRMNRVGLVKDWHYQQLCIRLKTIYQSTEPNEMPRETSLALAKIFTALKADGVTRVNVAHELGLYVEEFNSLVFGLMLTAGPGQAKAAVPTPDKRPPIRLV